MDTENLLRFGYRFKKYRGKRIVFYINNFVPTPYFKMYREYKFIGIMDKYTTQGEAYGREILSFERAAALKTDVIIIASEPQYYELIRRRIAGFCREKGILLYAIDGTRLSVEDENRQSENPYSNLSKNNLFAKIQKSDVIFFDIDDVLITESLHSETLYELVRKKTMINNFVDVRLQIEQELRRNGLYTLENVYNSMKKEAVFSEEQIRNLYVAEKNTRFEVTVSRNEILDLYNSALDASKTVVLVDNGFWSEEDLEYLLEKNKISYFHDIIVKNPEQLDIKVCELVQGENKEILYLKKETCNDKSEYGNNIVEVFEIPSIESMANISKYSLWLNSPCTLYERIKREYFTSRIFNSPFALFETNGRGKVERVADISKYFVAPLIFDYMVWLINEIKKNDIEYILFGARDGFLIKKIYDLFKEKGNIDGLPEGEYFYTSRLLCGKSEISTITDLKKALSTNYKGSTEDILKKRFGLFSEEIIKFNEEDSLDAQEYVLLHADKILNRAKETRERYLSYGKKCGIYKYSKIAFYDFVASGTCQKSVCQIFNKELLGLYFCRLNSVDEAKRKLKINSFVNDNIKIEENALFMECIFTSPEPAVIDFNQKGEPIFADETRSIQEIEYCTDMQNGVLEYVAEMLDVIGDISVVDSVDVDDMWLDFLYPDYSLIEPELFHNYVVKDEFIECHSCVGNLYRY